MFISPVRLVTGRVGSLTLLIHTLLYVMIVHTRMYEYSKILYSRHKHFRTHSLSQDSYSKGSTVIMPRQFDQRVSAFMIKVPWEDPGIWKYNESCP